MRTRSVRTSVWGLVLGVMLLLVAGAGGGQASAKEASVDDDGCRLQQFSVTLPVDQESIEATSRDPKCGVTVELERSPNPATGDRTGDCTVVATPSVEGGRIDVELLADNALCEGVRTNVRVDDDRRAVRTAAGPSQRLLASQGEVWADIWSHDVVHAELVSTFSELSWWYDGTSKWGPFLDPDWIINSAFNWSIILNTSGVINHAWAYEGYAYGTSTIGSKRPHGATRPGTMPAHSGTTGLEPVPTLTFTCTIAASECSKGRTNERLEAGP